MNTPKGKKMKKRVCPTCFERSVVPSVIPVHEAEMKHDWSMYKITLYDVPVNQCEKCQSFNIMDGELEENALRKAAGILFPNEIRDIREKLNLTVEDFAKTIGVIPKQLEGFEEGLLYQSKSADILIRLMDHLSEFKDYFKESIHLNKQK